MLGNRYNSSLLRKNYDFIQETLNRNIGEINYKQDYGYDMAEVSMVGYGKPLADYATTIRNSFANYVDYAISLNPELVFFNTSYPIDFFGSDILKNSEKDALYQQYLAKDSFASLNQALSDAANRFLNAVDIDSKENFTYAYDKLRSISNHYISYVNQLMAESNIDGTYQFGYGIINGVRVVVPHQITRGYSYASLKSDINDGISVVNNISSVYNLDVRLNTPFTTLNIVENTDYPKLTDNNLSNDIIGDFNIANVKSEYGRMLDSAKGWDLIYNLETDGDLKARYTFDTKSIFESNYGDSTIYVYNEAYDENPLSDFELTSSKSGADAVTTSLDDLYYRSTLNRKSGKDLMGFTNNQFRNGKYKTMIAKFGSFANDESKDAVKEKEEEIYHTAISSYGTSHGRNLLRKYGNRDVWHSGGKMYNDPYCRVWTNYHQYSHVRNLIRPFADEYLDEARPYTSDELYDKYGFNRVRAYDDSEMGNGQQRLSKYGVMGDSGFINITPKRNDDDLDFSTKTKQCMFSIENLAWKGAWNTNDEINGLSKEQQGPFGGRIMWFPPYGLSFNEQVSANWTETQFIGRGEKVFSYTDTDRTGTLNFILLIDHPSILNEFDLSNDGDRNGSDDKFDQNGSEYDILRFFAGCGIPKLKDRKPNLYQKEEAVDDEEEQEFIEPQDPPHEEPTPTEGELNFMVYFPNNYSGIEDIDFVGKNGMGVDPIVYLINGIGSQKQSKIVETANGGSKKELVDLPTDENVKSYLGTNEIVGYEMNIRNETSQETLTSGISYFNYDDLKDAQSIDSLTECDNDTVSAKYSFKVYTSATTIVTINSENASGDTFVVRQTNVKLYNGEGNFVRQTNRYVDNYSTTATTWLEKWGEPTSQTSGNTTYRYSVYNSQSSLNSSGTVQYKNSVIIDNIHDDDKTIGGGVEKIIITKDYSLKTSISTSVSGNQVKVTVKYSPIISAETENGDSNYLFSATNNSLTKKFNERTFTETYTVDFTQRTNLTVSGNTSDYDFTARASEFALAPMEGQNRGYPNQSVNNAWWYRIDGEQKSKSWKYKNQQLGRGKKYNSANYMDLRSYGLNANGFYSISDMLGEYYEIEDANNTYSLTDMFLATAQKRGGNITKLKENLEGYYDSEKLETLVKILNEAEDITIETQGYASTQGYVSSSNIDLVNNRAKVLAEWCRYAFPNVKEVKPNTVDVEGKNQKKTKTNNDENERLAKLGRAAKATIKYKLYSVDHKSTETDDTINEELTDKKYDPQTMHFVVSNQIAEATTNNSLQDVRAQLDAKASLLRFNDFTADNPVPKNNALANLQNDLRMDAESRTIGVDSRYVPFEYNNEVGEKRMWTRERLDAHYAAKDAGFVRYDNEYEFFHKIWINDPILRTKIKEKVKYFNPAFHSITPEGFNSRLTFLHQCTRQGPTCGNSDINNSETKTANNLAFGRQPVCILRIGDFFYTRIIIKNISIDYDQGSSISWDLNQEGIGVQPMYAKVSISFSFIGGSDIAGPIARLQNAVSFNYYANTSVYDNRSEIVEYDDKGELIRYKTYNPIGEQIKNTEVNKS